AGELGDEPLHFSSSADARIEEALPEVALALEQGLRPGFEHVVIEAEGMTERLAGDTSEVFFHDGVIERAPLVVEERVRVSLPSDHANALTRRALEHAADPQVSEFVNVRVLRLRIDAVEQSGDRAQRGALAGLVAAEDHVDPRLRKIQRHAS